MKDFVEEFQKKHSKIKVDEERLSIVNEDDEGNEFEDELVSYNITSIPGLDNLTLNLSEKNEFDKLDALIQSKPTLFGDFLGGRFGEQVEVVLTKLSKNLLGPSLSRPLTAKLCYQGHDVTISISSSRTDKSSIGFIALKLVGVRIQRNHAVALVQGLDITDAQKLEGYTQQILRSVLFDIEYTYAISFETTNLENLKSSRFSMRRPRTLPNEPIQLIYKDYIPELIEYFHVAEKVDYLPFKYICYFHVLEYFMDKSAYSVVSRKVKQLLLSPDFHIRSSEYIAHAVNIIKVETERNTTDKIKISRVIGEFTQPDRVQTHLSSLRVLDHFNKEHILTCSKPLKLVAVRFDSEQSFIDSVSRRIYAVRCSIVHSNPDFDESKAVPFLPTPRNIEFLRTEIELIKELSRTIICNSVG